MTLRVSKGSKFFEGDLVGFKPPKKSKELKVWCFPISCLSYKLYIFWFSSQSEAKTKSSFIDKSRSSSIFFLGLQKSIFEFTSTKKKSQIWNDLNLERKMMNFFFLMKFL